MVNRFTTAQSTVTMRRWGPLAIVPLAAMAALTALTADAAAICVKAGNAVILRGGSEAIRSNLALASGRPLREALVDAVDRAVEQETERQRFGATRDSQRVCKRTSTPNRPVGGTVGTACAWWC